MPGAKGQQHFITKGAGHFSQEDASDHLAKRLAEFAMV